MDELDRTVRDTEEFPLIDEEEIEEVSRLEEDFLTSQHESFDRTTQDVDDHMDLIETLVECCPQEWRSALNDFLDDAEDVPDTVENGTELLERRFQDFSLRETQLSHGNPRQLVKPSGSLENPVLLKLHYPSFTTDHILDGEVADDTSPCPRLLMRFEFSGWCEKTSVAKVEIHFGNMNKNKHQTLSWMRNFVVSFDAGLHIPVSLEFDRGRIKRVHIFMCHPQFLFFLKTQHLNQLYNQGLGLAAAITYLQVDYGYFARRSEILGLGGNALDDLRHLRGAENKGRPPGLWKIYHRQSLDGSVERDRT